MSFYLWAMRGAPAILFVIALVTLFGMLAATLGMGDLSSPYSSQPTLGFVQMMSALIAASQAAAWPLFGAAALWRADRWLAGRAEASE